MMMSDLFQSALHYFSELAFYLTTNQHFNLFTRLFPSRINQVLYFPNPIYSNQLV